MDKSGLWLRYVFQVCSKRGDSLDRLFAQGQEVNGGEAMECPNQHGRIEVKSMVKELSFRR